jgi:hypothetical protein
VSLGLGASQRRVLGVLDEKGSLSTAEIADLLGVNERRARTIFASLVDRGEAKVFTDGGVRRLWSADARIDWQIEQIDQRKELWRLGKLPHQLPRTCCPTCGRPI